MKSKLFRSIGFIRFWWPKKTSTGEHSHSNKQPNLTITWSLLSTSTFQMSSNLLIQTYLKITTVVLLYWFVSITMVFLNKKVLNQLDAPFFITWFQCLITAISLAIFRLIVDMAQNDRYDPDLKHTKNYSRYPDNIPENDNIEKNNSTSDLLEIIQKQLLLPTAQIHWIKVRKMLPLSVIFVAMISFNNLSLHYVSVPFYFIVRSLTPVFNLVFTYVILHRRTSIPAIFCCLGIISGFALGVDQENIVGTLSIAGVVCGILSSMFVSLNAIYVADMLSVVDNNVCQLSYYNSFIGLFLFMPFILINGELNDIWRFTFPQQNPPPTAILNFWMLMLLTGIFGLLISIVTNLQIKHTSPLTHNISGTAKACTQTVLATYLFKQHKTFQWWLSNIIVLFWSAAYTFAKQRELKQQMVNKQSSLLPNNDDDDDADDPLNIDDLERGHPQTSSSHLRS